MGYDSKFDLYIVLGGITANVLSSAMLGSAISKGKLEDILIWSGVTFVNTGAAIGNVFRIYKERNKI